MIALLGRAARVRPSHLQTTINDKGHGGFSIVLVLSVELRR